ncbi:MAG: lipopolysaccharide export system ATP-binding protein [Abditibacteriota bacterium]|nr:lipopolysaccharide export system ATP-binding protein [Abditibacteriota bacterium]
MSMAATNSQTTRAASSASNVPSQSTLTSGYLEDGSPAAIVASDLQKRYGPRRVVDSVSVDVGRGEVVGLLGPNGAGKTTSFYMIMGLVRADAGRVQLGAHDVTRWPMHRRARGGMGYLAQNESVFRKLSIQDNILAILELMPLEKSERVERCDQLLEDFNLTGIRHSPGAAVSGGERRRCEIARTLATDPYFILLDEPFTGVDPLAVQEIQSIVLKLRERGIGILITDHNVHDTLDIIDRAYILYNGKIMTQGTAHELLTDERARELYFGEKIGRHQVKAEG